MHFYIGKFNPLSMKNILRFKRFYYVRIFSDKFVIIRRFPNWILEKIYSKEKIVVFYSKKAKGKRKSTFLNISNLNYFFNKTIFVFVIINNNYR